ncbi:hypothetical protein F5Y14DRAFT_178198 [Nemania sp. NC0429]|nr:hypothetical protein F5Y14DRAFT_178198 [Nemania sp. NC0429]
MHLGYQRLCASLRATLCHRSLSGRFRPNTRQQRNSASMKEHDFTSHEGFSRSQIKYSEIPIGRLSKPIYTRTSVLCNGQIAWKVGRDKDMEYDKTDPQRADLRPVTDVTDDLHALNSLQIQRSNPLTPIEIKQPLRHVQSCLPTAVRPHVYTGDLYGSAGGVFHACSDSEFQHRLSGVFGNETRANGAVEYNNFFRPLRRAEWLLWDVEAEEGHWAAVIAHLYKGKMPNPNKKDHPDNPDVPAVVQSFSFNRIDEWCVVTARRSPRANKMVDRIRKRLPAVLAEGNIGLDEDSEIYPAIWIPTNNTTWASGLCVYDLIKTLMHRVTEFHCRRLPHQKSFWSPLPGWLNLDEVRAEMQGRAAQRCMAATGYRSRIAIEGVRPWLGAEGVIPSNRLRPRRRDSRAYVTGQVEKDGHCVPVDPFIPLATDSDELTDDTEFDNYNRVHGGPVGRPPPRVVGWDKDALKLSSGMFEFVPVGKLGKRSSPKSEKSSTTPKKSSLKAGTTLQQHQSKPGQGTNGNLVVDAPLTGDSGNFEHLSPVRKGFQALPKKQATATATAKAARRGGARQAEPSPVPVATRKSARILKRKADESAMQAAIKVDLMAAGGIQQLIKRRTSSLKSVKAGASDDEIA